MPVWRSASEHENGALYPNGVERMINLTTEEIAAKDRKDFFSKITSIVTTTPAQDVPKICNIWMETTGADWAWLWLYNETAGKWELIGCTPDESAEFLEGFITTPSVNCAAEFCNRMKDHRFINSPANWKEVCPGSKEEYIVVLGEVVARHGCKAIDCIPLLQPAADTKANDASPSKLKIRAAVCLYYRDPSRRRAQQSEVFVMMGRLTASMIIDSFEADERQLLFTLNHLTERYLTSEKADPEQLRSGYLSELRALLSNHLNVENVSIFWEEPFQERLVCVESSGLWNSEGKPVPRDGISNVRYAMNQGITGRVFATGKLHRSEIGAPSDHKPRFTEIPPNRRESDVAWAICPIPFYTGDQADQKSRPVQGVIRCSVSNALFSKKMARDIDSIQLENLSFITRQIAPVLEAMAANIFRELSISVIKHDLFAPIRMIMDTGKEINQDISRGRKPPDYALNDLSTSAYLAEQLVRQLDPNPTAIAKLIQKPTLMEGDIVARIKAMLQHYAQQEQGMKLSFGDFRNFPCLNIDPVLIERVLHNLIVNAIKYGEEGSEIRVMPLLTKENLVVAVSNYGIGVEPEEAPHLFSGRYRSPRAQRRSHGLGLGLKISKAAMEAHGGRIELTQAKAPTIVSMVFPRELISNQ